jgi:hypothetical protein
MSDLPDTAVEIRLAARPQGWPTEENFEIAEVPVATPGPGQVLVRNTVLSVDPYMRGRMDDRPSYVPPFQVGKALEGAAVGEVVASADPDRPVGATVLHMAGWREYALLPGKAVAPVDTGLAPAAAYLGVLGVTGFTAWVGLVDIAGQREGDTVFVSGAAGAVGSVVGQVAKLRGAARVIGSAGSAEKVAWLIDELGFDAAFDYHDGPVGKQLRAAAPEGIDVYFDNVGGEHLEAAIGALRVGGRAAECGMISQYNDTEPGPGPRNLAMLVTKRLTLRGFIITDHGDRHGAFMAEVGGWLAAGKLAPRETYRHGIRATPGAFLDLLRGANTGKMLVAL